MPRPQTDDFSVLCAWCEKEVVSFVAPPAMVEVTAQVQDDPRRHLWRICLFCYGDMIKLIAARAHERV